jgi:beta-glucanase (GH16 family)
LDPAKWTYETGFVRNQELQWYQPVNAFCQDGFLIIEARKEKVRNTRYLPESADWRRNREYSEYTSACVITKGLYHWQYGAIEMQAKIKRFLIPMTG